MIGHATEEESISTGTDQYKIRAREGN